MKIKKTLAAIAAAAMTLSAFATSVSAAEAKTLDFENGTCGVIGNKADEVASGAAADADISIVDYNGSKMLKVSPKSPKGADGTYLVPKIEFDLDMLAGANIVNVRKITFDFIVEATEVNEANGAGEDGTIVLAPNWCGGGGGFNVGADGSVWAGTAEWSVQTDDAAATPVQKYEGKLLKPSDAFDAACTGSKFLFMHWGYANARNIYIDNVQLLDKDGNAVALTIDAVSADYTTASYVSATPDTTTPDTTTPDTTTPDTTTPDTTGNADTGSSAGLAVLGLALAGAAIVATKKK